MSNARQEQPGQSASADCPFFLSFRQRQALGLAAQGLTVPAIARLLGLAPQTVAKHLQLARETLGAMNTTHAVAIAVAWRLIDIENFLIGEINCSSPAA